MNRTLHLLGGVTMASVCACAPMVRGVATDASHTATPIVIDETLRTLEDQNTRDRIAAIAGSPEMKRTMGELASSLVRGRFEDPETVAEVERMTAAFARILLETLRAEVGSLSPQIRMTVRRAVAEMVGDATREVTLVLAEDVPDRLAPAIRTAVTTQLEEPEFRSALSSTTREIAKQAFIGSQEAMATQGGAHEPPGVLFRAGRLLRTANVGVVFAMVVATIVLAVWIWRRRYRNGNGSAHVPEPPIFL